MNRADVIVMTVITVLAGATCLAAALRPHG